VSSRALGSLFCDEQETTAQRPEGSGAWSRPLNSAPVPARVLVCDVGALQDADEVAFEVLARLQLEARRHGLAVELRNASPNLLALIELFGLRDALPCECSAVDVRRQIDVHGQVEKREQLGVHEKRDARDPTV